MCSLFSITSKESGCGRVRPRRSFVQMLGLAIHSRQRGLGFGPLQTVWSSMTFPMRRASGATIPARSSERRGRKERLRSPQADDQVMFHGQARQDRNRRRPPGAIRNGRLAELLRHPLGKARFGDELESQQLGTAVSDFLEARGRSARDRQDGHASSSKLLPSRFKPGIRTSASSTARAARYPVAPSRQQSRQRRRHEVVHAGLAREVRRPEVLRGFLRIELALVRALILLPSAAGTAASRPFRTAAAGWDRANRTCRPEPAVSRISAGAACKHRIGQMMQQKNRNDRVELSRDAIRAILLRIARW